MIAIEIGHSLKRAGAMATLAAMTTLGLGVAPASAAISWTCDYTASNHQVRLTLSGSGLVLVARDGSRITVDFTWCESKATVFNTDQIVILAGDGDQHVAIQLFAVGSSDTGFQPGHTDEPGSSDEIEIAVSLGGGNDKLSISSSDDPDNIVLGRSSGRFVMGAINLNAQEATGVDNDLKMTFGIETVEVAGRGGNDKVSAAGGFGTGERFGYAVRLIGGDGNDNLTGGAAGDYLSGGYGNDTLKGGPGPDYLDSSDGVSGNDTVQGGTGFDTCDTDAGDSRTSCP